MYATHQIETEFINNREGACKSTFFGLRNNFLKEFRDKIDISTDIESWKKLYSFILASHNNLNEKIAVLQNALKGLSEVVNDYEKKLKEEGDNSNIFNSYFGMIANNIHFIEQKLTDNQIKTLTDEFNELFKANCKWKKDSKKNKKPIQFPG